ncbi:hypothetical protein PU629_07920 [Pullulanibacillus sp. KACC 23026]|uniref:hypothetical protein n=1 Tax=Pullulanibacillus sp. KACC 23026 TaxID=3028315 RepID=UPI0023B06D21|nr:hypothetical protein [Pullulanibacillus sp. KACC 23026]WEG14274.1 hypothetical protein PU629_07920 [Pullulanibacillus sp. KACC 23026]
MLRRNFIWIIFLALLTATLIHTYIGQHQTINSLTYFPNDPAIHFTKAETNLSLEPIDASSSYKIHWEIASETNLPVYLRQDVGLLFQNGKLIQVSNKWKQQVTSLTHHQSVSTEGNRLFEGLTVHYAESHLSNGAIGSAEVMSYDHLFVQTGDSQKPEAFKIPVDQSETKFYQKLSRSIEQEQQSIIKQAAKNFHLKLKDYAIIPLTRLETYRKNALPGQNKKNSQKVISQLWEGLYKNYILGIHLSNHDIESPIGSSMPIILYPKKNNELYVIIQTKEGQLQLLKQSITN